MSAVDLKREIKNHKEGRHLNGKKKLLSHSNADMVKYLYWFIICMGVAVCSYRYFYVRQSGEVGCIARQGNLMYFLVGCAVIVFQLTFRA